ncbi:MAG TPA: patatin-like phospholipase family protein [Streptosporangiaceae bacterium]
MLTRALVLGSGGLTGIAWEAGVLQGLAEGGTLVGDWDLVVGSSAGAYVGARLLAEGSAEPVFAAQLAVNVRAEEQALSAATGRLLIWLVRAARRPGLGGVARAGVLPLALRALTVNAARHGLGEFAALGVLLRSRRPGGSGAQTVRALGRMADGSRTPEGAWIGYWERALGPVQAWPPGQLAVTAVGIADGSRRTIGRSDEVPLARAVAASAAVAGILPAITVSGQRYMDGGTASQTNADLAAGYDQVLVVAPADRGALDAELSRLRAGGREVVVIRPGGPAAAVLGDELARLDPARIRASAQAGREDGRAAVPVFGLPGRAGATTS